MAIFDFIGGEDFRSTLESDYRELNVCVENGAWKAAHVIAGSIIEAILVDYLMITDYQQTSKNQLFKMELKDLIDICTQRAILAERTVHISHAIKSYRNLIHPGRLVRTKETADKDSAIVVLALVNMVIKEVIASKQKKYGYTAEQIVAKIENDSSSTAILSHLLRDTNDFEKERLLLEIIPQRYIYFLNSEEAVNRVLLSLSECFRQMYEIASDDVKRKVAKASVKVVKEESELIAHAYEVNFFRVTDLEYYADEDKDLIKQYLFSILKKSVSGSLLKALTGIGKYLTAVDQVSTVFNILIKTYAFGVYDAKESDIKYFIVREFENLCNTKFYNFGYLVEIVGELFDKYNFIYKSDQGTFNKLINLKNIIFDPFFEDEECEEDDIDQGTLNKLENNSLDAFSIE